MDSVAVNPDELKRLQEIEARVCEELLRYGILQPGDELKIGVGGVEGLLRHIYGNRDLVVGTKDYHISLLEAQLASLRESLVTLRVAQGEDEADVRAEIESQLVAAARAA